MGIAGITNLNAANTAYEAAFQEVFAGGPPGTWQLFTEKKTGKSKFLELDVISSFPRVREWIGAKQFKDFRAYRQIVELTTYEVSHSQKRRDVDYDYSGTVGQALAGFVRQSAFIYDDILWNSAAAANGTGAGLLTNPTGYDGVSLLNDSHPNCTGTSDNLVTSALSYEVFRAGIQNMELITDEDGKPLGISPTHLFVGPKQRRIALEITGATRPVSVDSSGAYDTTSSVVGATAIPNVYEGEVQVVVVPWITGNQWFLMDLGKPAAKPMVLFEARAPEAIPVTEMASQSRFTNDEYQWSIECDVTPAAGMWQTIYGSVTA